MTGMGTYLLIQAGGKAAGPLCLYFDSVYFMPERFFWNLSLSLGVCFVKEVFQMKRKSILPALALAAALLLSACAASGSTSGPTPVPMPAQGVSAEKDGIYNEETGSLDITGTRSGSTADSTAYSSAVYSGTDSKLIRKAALSIQTTEFEAAVAALDQLTNKLGGYYEYAQTQAGGYYDSSAARYASYTVRVPKENCDAFLTSAGEIGHVVSSSESSTDVGEEYHDTQLRLKTLQTKQDRLLALMEKADVMEDIITLENSLSDVQYQIEQLTSTLQRYDSLVDYATISLSINEVIRITDEPGEGDSLAKRVSAAFANGLNDFAQGLSNLAVWAAYHIIGIAAFAAAAAVVVAAVRRGRLFRRRKPNPPAPPENGQP